MAVTSSRNARSAWARAWLKLTTLNPFFLTIVFFLSMIYPFAIAYDIELGRLWGYIIYVAFAFGGTICHTFDSTVYGNPAVWILTRLVGWGYTAVVTISVFFAYSQELKWWMLFVVLLVGYLSSMFLKLKAPQESGVE